MAGNSLFVIRPYLWNDLWVFDDEQPPRARRNGQSGPIIREPFVSGIDDMLDRVTRHLPDPRRCLVIFSAEPFPGADVVLEWVRGDQTDERGEGNWYRWPETGMEGWLCPVLFRYFESAPERIFIQIRPAR
ncbi:MAG: hypothetical protein NZ700_14280 [Gemmataceae bacterium]|nr:hypothetical protein [Gemmataceae bacterium]MDW8264331.1 DUF6717 family protein [Gemmataceae bacterium]